MNLNNGKGLNWPVYLSVVAPTPSISLMTDVLPSTTAV